MTSRFRTKEDLIRYLRREIKNLERKIERDLRESVRMASKGKYDLTDWSIDTMGTISDFWLFITIDGNETNIGFSQPGREDYEAMAEALDFPKEWLNDDRVADHLWLYLAYDRILAYSDAIYEDINQFIRWFERVSEKKKSEVIG